MLKTLCNKIVSCISSLFKSEKDEYREKLIPLQQMIEQQSRIKGSQVKHYPKTKPLKMLNNQYQQNQRQKTAIPTPHHPPQQHPNSKISPYKPKPLNLPSIKTKARPASPNIEHSTKPPNQLVKSVSFTPKIEPIKVVSPDRQRGSNNSEDSFHTLQSGSSSLHSIARRSFKSIRSLKNSKNQEIKLAGEGKNYRKPKVYKKSFDSRDFKSINNQSFSSDRRMVEFQSSNYKDLGAKKISELLIQWNSKEYMKLENCTIPYKRSFSSQRLQQSRFMSQIFYEKIASNSHLDELINRLEDYYTFNFEDKQFEYQINEFNPAPNPLYPMFSYHQQSTNENQPSLKIAEIRSPARHIQKTLSQKYEPNFGFYYNQSLGLKCSYSFSKNQQNAHHSISMKSIQFYCDTSSPLKILKWYNCSETRSKLFDFHKMYLLENGIYPVLQVQQFNELYQQKNIYRMVRQIQIGTFENENTSFPEGKNYISRPKIEEAKQNEYVLQIQMTIESDAMMRKKHSSEKYCDDKPWKSLLRFEIAEKGLVQIYEESYQEIHKENVGVYNKKRWSRFQQKLVRDKMVRYGYKNGIVHM